MSSRTDPVDILMYHSVSELGGPTATPEPVFRAQMEALAASGVPVLSLDALAQDTWPGAGVVLTFDDGFADFATAAWPVIRDHGWPVTVYVPTGFVGAVEGWKGIADPPRPLMDWPTIERLAAEGVTFGGHTHTHPDLAALPDAQIEDELTTNQELLQARTGQAVAHFAPPYGRATAAVRALIARRFRTSAGTRLNQARSTDDPHDLPRLEVFYYRDPNRWAAHLAGRGGPYLSARRALRGIKDRLTKPWERV